MANAREIKDRMSSVKDTRKITNAMYLIASTKLQKARRGLDNTKPFFKALREEISHVFCACSDIENRYFYSKGEGENKDGKYGILAITADKGLAGSYNQNVIKETERLIKAHENYELYVIGSYGRQYFEKHGCNIAHVFEYAASKPTMYRAREIRDVMLDRYLAEEIDTIYIVYTDMEKNSEALAKSVRLLPFSKDYFVRPTKDIVDKRTDFEYPPSAGSVLDRVMPTYISGFVFSAIVDSFCCEQNARMSAMDSANRNADKIIKELTIQYNRVRQAAITQEITEVSAGAKAQKKKREKQKKCILEKL